MFFPMIVDNHTSMCQSNKGKLQYFFFNSDWASSQNAIFGQMGSFLHFSKTFDPFLLLHGTIAESGHFLHRKVYGKGVVAENC